jgi:hypothetical protein
VARQTNASNSVQFDGKFTAHPGVVWMVLLAVESRNKAKVLYACVDDYRQVMLP